MLSKFFKDKYFTVLCIVAVGAFFVYSFLSFNSPLIFNSPDATSNYFFIERFAKGESLAVFEPLNILPGSIIHPRSINVKDASLVPGGFLGIILIYGFISKILGLGIILFLTPLFSVLAIISFYKLIKIISDNEKLAFMSSILLMIHPSFWYYTSRGLLPNVLFIDLLIIGIYLLLSAIQNTTTKLKWLQWIAGVIIAVLSLWVRPVEIVWVLPMLCVLGLTYKKTLSRKHIIIFVIAVFLTFLPILFYNQIIYGGPFLTGYSNLATTQEINNIVTTNIPDSLKIPLHSRLLINNFYNYFIKIFWPYTLFILIGMVFTINDWLNKQKKSISNFRFQISDLIRNLKFKIRNSIPIVLLLYCFIVLVVYYGSWDIHDNITPGIISFGSSYTRYWLPLYIMCIPLIAAALIKISEIIKIKIIKISFISLVMLIFGFFSWQTVMMGDEGLLAIKNHLIEYQQKKELVLSLTEKNAIILSDRYDKVFFPERRVIHGVTQQNNLKNLPLILKTTPVYLYSFYSDKDLPVIQNQFKKYGMSLEYYKTITEDERLFRIMKYEL